MKMGAGLIWGIALILIGIVIVIRVVFNIQVPVFKIILSLVLISWGVKMFLGCFNVHVFKQRENMVLFGENVFEGLEKEHEEMNTIFGKSTIDLRANNEIIPGQSLELNVVFGNCELYLPKGVPYRMKIEVAFGAVDIPKGGPTGFGTRQYQSDGLVDSLPFLNIDAHVVFGNLEVKGLSHN